MDSCILGIDYGTAKCGIAKSFGNVAIPWKTLPRNEIKEFISNFTKEFLVTKIVIGLPLHMNGEESDMSRKARNFAKDLQNYTNVPIVLFDERLTSQEAKLAQSMTGDQKTIDAVAASILLETYILSTGATHYNTLVS